MADTAAAPMLGAVPLLTACGLGLPVVGVEVMATLSNLAVHNLAGLTLQTANPAVAIDGMANVSGEPIACQVTPSAL